jgi:hypothetical protein
VALSAVLSWGYSGPVSSEPPSRQQQGSGRYQGPGTSGVLRVLFITDNAALRAEAWRELSPGFELLPAKDFSLAEPLLDIEPGPSAIIIDLRLAKDVAGFLARLVERDYTGPRILLSGRFRPEEAGTLNQSCVVHFALTAPWAEGELRAVVEAALGFRPFPNALPTL